jgi:hypothetical protein
MRHDRRCTYSMFYIGGELDSGAIVCLKFAVYTIASVVSEVSALSCHLWKGMTGEESHLVLVVCLIQHGTSDDGGCGLELELLAFEVW